MASDQRDWNRDWWRKRLGHVERSSFRMGEDDKRRLADRLGWRRNLLVVAALVLGIVVVKIPKTLM